MLCLIFQRSDLTPRYLLQRSQMPLHCTAKVHDSLVKDAVKLTPCCILQCRYMTPRCNMQRRDSTNCCVLQQRDLTLRYMMQRKILQNIFVGLSAVNTVQQRDNFWLFTAKWCSKIAARYEFSLQIQQEVSWQSCTTPWNRNQKQKSFRWLIRAQVGLFDAKKPEVENLALMSFLIFDKPSYFLSNPL